MINDLKNGYSAAEITAKVHKKGQTSGGKRAWLNKAALDESVVRGLCNGNARQTRRAA